MTSRRKFLRTAAAVAPGAVLLPGLATSAYATPGDPSEQPVRRTAGLAYGGVRIGRVSPGQPSVPEIILPTGYRFVAGDKYHFASRWQYYTFIEGPPSDSVPVEIRWPRTPIAAVVGENGPITTPSTGHFAVRANVPVAGTAVTEPILQVRAAPPTDPGIFFRIEHNDPDRAAGVWTTVPWPETERRSIINYLSAAELIVRTSGLAAVAAGRGHFFYLTGFETFTTLHPDNPPHWHLGYYPGTFSSPGVNMPHFLIDKRGRTFRNGLDVPGRPRQNYLPGQPAPLTDPAGKLIVTLTIRADGGLDVITPAGRTYSIAAPASGTFSDGVRVLRDGRPWRSIRTSDHTKAGLLTIITTGDGGPVVKQFRYDPVTALPR